MAGFLQCYLTVSYAAPMTNGLRAALTTSSVMKVRPLIFSIRSICTKSRWRRRKLPPGDAGNRSGGLGVRKIHCIETQPEFAPMPSKDEGVFIALQRAVVVSKTDPAIELRIACHAFFHAGHPNQDQTDVAAIE
jgi:hypothetical protein